MSTARIFGYGSNMYSQQIKSRCPSFKFLHIACALNYELVFNKYSQTRKCGAANIRVQNGQSVWGIIFEISKSDVLVLDKAEKGYARSQIKVQSESKLGVQCEAYIAPAEAKIHLPSRDYLDTILKGAREYSLPPGYIEFLLKQASI